MGDSLETADQWWSKTRDYADSTMERAMADNRRAVLELKRRKMTAPSDSLTLLFYGPTPLQVQGIREVVRSGWKTARPAAGA